MSGLDKHQLSSEKPLKYSHLDIAGSAGSHTDNACSLYLQYIEGVNLFEDLRRIDIVVT